MISDIDAAGDVVAVEVFVLRRLEPALDDTVGPQGSARVRTWVRCGRVANQRATDFMAGPLSVTITRGTRSPVASRNSRCANLSTGDDRQPVHRLQI